MNRPLSTIRLPVPPYKHAQSKGKNTPLTWTGYSRAGDATCFVVPEQKWMFDCGCRVVEWRPHCLFITHTHADHIQALAQVLFSIKPLRSTNSSVVSIIHVYFPAVAEGAVRALLQAFYNVVRDDDDDDCTEETTNETADLEALYAFRLIPVLYDVEFTLPRPTSNTTKQSNATMEFSVRTIYCQHRKPCVGYSLHQRQWVRKTEYVRCTSDQLAALGRQGVALQEWGPLAPVLCFLGDTTKSVFCTSDTVLRQQSIICVECTYYMDEDTERAVVNQHVHWNDLRRVILSYSNGSEQQTESEATGRANTDHDHSVRPLFVLQHFSLKHKADQWMAWMHQFNVESGLYNVHVMLEAVSTATTSCNCFVCRPMRSDAML